jgi:ABC-type transport system involved in multi-copper enzyme maturation permease subunit
MHNQLKAEFYKLRSTKSFYIVILIYAIFSTFQFEDAFFSNELGISGQQVILGAISEPDLLFVIALLMSSFVGSDFTNRTITNEIRIGYSRISVVFSRAIVVFAVTVMLYLLYVIPGALVMSISNGFGDVITVGEVLIRAILFAFQVMAVISFTLLIVFWCKNASRGMKLSTFFTLITCNILRSFFYDNAIFQATTFYRIQMNERIMTSQDIIISFVSAIATLAAVLFATYMVFRKADLK